MVEPVIPSTDRLGTPGPGTRRPVTSSYAIAPSAKMSAEPPQARPSTRSGAEYGRRTGARRPARCSASATPTSMIRASPSGETIASRGWRAP